MAKYMVRFLDADGVRRESILTCNTEEQARRYCAAKGYAIQELRLGKPRKEVQVAGPTAVAAPPPPVPSKPPRVGRRELALAFSQLAMMLNQAIPIHTALRIAGKSGSPGLDLAFSRVTARVEGGNTVSSSMSLFPRVFPEYVRSAVHMGEKSGRLTDVLQKLSEWLERGGDMERRALAAMVYPGVILTVCGLLGGFMFSVMLPGIVGSLQLTPAQMPTLTRVLMFLATSPVVRLSMLGLLVLLALVGHWVSQEERRMARVLALTFRLPVVGRLGRNLALARWLERLAMVLDSGTDLYSALRLTADIGVGPPELVRALPRLADSICHGDTLSGAFSRFPEAFPRGLRSLTAVAEETAGVQKTLESYSRILESDTEQQMDAVLDLVEPLMMLVMGSLVGLIVLAVFLPIYQSTSLF